jgi:hypothetical protein
MVLGTGRQGLLTQLRAWFTRMFPKVNKEPENQEATVRWQLNGADSGRQLFRAEV